jgi:hypothetical protein
MKQDEFYIENSSKPFHVEARFEATDFRLGNWFLGNGYMQQVTLETFEYLLNERFYPHKAIQGIPLTPEILEKAGFVYMTEPNENYWNYNKPDVYLYLNEKLEPGLYSNEYEHVDVIGNPLQYLHQLQNLYFALTNNELEITF